MYMYVQGQQKVGCLLCSFCNIAPLATTSAIKEVCCYAKQQPPPCSQYCSGLEALGETVKKASLSKHVAEQPVTVPDILSVSLAGP